MGPAENLLAQMRSARESMVELEPGKRLKIRRPRAAEMHLFAAVVTPALVTQFAVGWDGVTQADLLPPGVGSSDAAPFTADLCEETLADRPDWLHAAVKGMGDAMLAYADARGLAAKN